MPMTERAACRKTILRERVVADRSVQRRDGVIGTKRVSLDVVAELFDGIVRA